MIGVVGPVDSVALVTQVADEVGIGSILVARGYDSPEEAPGLTQELESVCSVLLFTGRVPFVMAAAGLRHVRTFYIPHDGTDLYRAIASLLLSPAHRGALPRLSFDSMEASQVSEAFRELGLDPPQHIVKLHGHNPEVIDLAGIADHHRQLFVSGEVDLCMTCIGVVHRRLVACGVEAVRIVHSRIVVREALTRARLSMDLHRAEAAQVAACVLRTRDTRGHSRGTLSRRVLGILGEKYSEILDGRVVKHSPGELVLLATRGSVERSLQSELANRAWPMNTELRQHVNLGIGFGTSASLAEDHARRALEAATSTQQHMMMALDEGTIIPLKVVGPVDTRVVRMENLRTANRLNISPTLVRRLGTVFRELDPSSFTASELASSYGVLPRSARRLIALLRIHGLVEECGMEKSAGAGRPQIAYRIALERMMSAD